jgi:hypothetical protein
MAIIKGKYIKKEAIVITEEKIIIKQFRRKEKKVI